MFYHCFRQNPVWPKGWEKLHLWIAQTFLASLIASREKEYARVKRVKTFTRKVMSDVRFSIERESQPWLSDDVLREAVLKGLDDYLGEEAFHLLGALRSNEFDPRPNGPKLMQALEEDAKLKQFISTLDCGDRSIFG